MLLALSKTIKANPLAGKYNFSYYSTSTGTGKSPSTYLLSCTCIQSLRHSHTLAHPAFTGSVQAYTGSPGILPTGITSPIGLNLGTEGGESSSEKSVLSVGGLGDIDREPRTTVKEGSIALKRKGKEKKENEAKIKKKHSGTPSFYWTLSHRWSGCG